MNNMKDTNKVTDSFVYLVMAITCYEGSSVINAYKNKESAELFASKIIKYEKKSPTVPCLDANSDDIWEQYYLDKEEWKK